MLIPPAISIFYYFLFLPLFQNERLENIDPDEAFSSIPYEKGSQFLFHLEKLVGVDEFENFFRNWIFENRFKSVTTLDFQAFFRNAFGEEKYNSVDWYTWLYQPGYPPIDILPKMDHSLAIEAKELANFWIKVNNKENEVPKEKSAFEKLSSEQKVYFLTQILDQSPKGLDHNILKEMAQLYQLNSLQNSEIRKAWLSLSLISGDHSCFDLTVQFVSEQGRMKFVRFVSLFCKL